jgi:hypothetical protein
MLTSIRIKKIKNYEIEVNESITFFFLFLKDVIREKIVEYYKMNV